MAASEYLMAGQRSELERLQLQARTWEPAGRRLLGDLGDGAGRRVLDVGCGALGWLGLLAEWVGPAGRVVGTDIDESLLAAAGAFVDEEGLDTVELVRDDLFASRLEPASFDLVHARFQLAPLGRAAEQLDAHRALVAPGGWLVLEEPDAGSWHFNPPAPAAQRLVELIPKAFTAAGGDFDAGRSLPGLLGCLGLAPEARAEVLALRPGHPYLRVGIQFSVSLEPRLAEMVTLDELRRLRADAERELSEPGRWGTTFTLIQAWAQIPPEPVSG
jgi:SAM-dependent methyltransferase